MSVLTHLVFIYVCVVMPWVGRIKYARLKTDLEAGHNEARLRFYWRTLLQQAALTLAVIAIWGFGIASRSALGLVLPQEWSMTTSLVGTVLLGMVASVFIFRRAGTGQLKRLMKMAGALIPVTSLERRVFSGLAVGAGISEELAFRGFLLFYLNHYFPQLNYLLLGLISSLIFGICHIYQGWRGILLTALVGFSFFFIYTATGSLVAPVLVHAAIDLRLLLILTPARLHSLQEA